MRCPRCKGTEFEKPPRGAAGYIHQKCVACGTVSFQNATNETPSDPLNWCGDPEKHWNEGTSLEGLHIPDPGRNTLGKDDAKKLAERMSGR